MTSICQETLVRARDGLRRIWQAVSGEYGTLSLVEGSGIGMLCADGGAVQLQCPDSLGAVHDGFRQVCRASFCGWMGRA